MQNSSVFLLIAGLGIFLLLLGFFLYRILYNRYLNKRLKGEIKQRNYFNYKAFAIIMSLSICAFTITFLTISLLQAKTLFDRYSIIEEKVSRKAIAVTDFALFPEYREYCNALTSGSLAGYEISVKTDGDFECYIGLPKGKIGNDFFAAQYYIFIRYTGGELDGETAQMERLISYDKSEQLYYGAMGLYEPELLLIGNTLEPHFYVSVETIIKLAPRTQETKMNWNNLPVYAQSRFIILI